MNSDKNERRTHRERGWPGDSRNKKQRDRWSVNKENKRETEAGLVSWWRWVGVESSRQNETQNNTASERKEMGNGGWHMMANEERWASLVYWWKTCLTHFHTDTYIHWQIWFAVSCISQVFLLHAVVFFLNARYILPWFSCQYSGRLGWQRGITPGYCCILSSTIK